MPKLKNKKIIIFLLALFLFLGSFQLTHAEVVSKTINSSSDDAGQVIFAWPSGMRLSDASIVLGTTDDWLGLRWTGVNIPFGSTITTAYFEIYLPDDSDDYFTNKVVYAQKARNPSTFATTPVDNISVRPRTQNSISLGTGAQGTGWKRSPSVVSLVQEVVDYSGTGDSLVILIESTGSEDLEIRTWDYTPVGSYAAKLYIEYTIPPNAPPAVTNSTGASNVTYNSARLNGELTQGYPEPTVYIYWGNNDGGTNPANWDSVENFGILGGIFYKDISGLTSDTTYFYRTYAVNSEGSDDWADETAKFKTMIAKSLTINSSSDDAEQGTFAWPSGMRLSYASISLYSTGEWAGFRWTGVNIPFGSTITTAYFEIYLPDDSDDYFTNKVVYAQKARNPSTFATTPVDNISVRPRTQNSISLGTGAQGTGWKRSPSVVSLVQEVVSYSGIGDSLVILIESTGSEDLEIRTWDYAPTGSYAAKLYVEYILPSFISPIVTNSTGASNVKTASARLNGQLTQGYPEPTVYIYWGNNDGGTNPANWDSVENFGILGGPFYKDISGLFSDTPYYYRTYAVNSQGSDWADTSAVFTTKITAIITATCSDPNKNLKWCNVTAPCTQSCSASGSSGSCSCEYRCVVTGNFDACGKAIDTKGLSSTACLPGEVKCKINRPPDKPVIPPEYPEGESWNHCSFQGLSVSTFHWTYSDPEGNPQTAYEIWVDDNSSFPDPKFNLLVEYPSPGYNSTAYTLDLDRDTEDDWLSELAWDTTYYWVVRVKDSTSWSSSSDPNPFTTPKHAYPWTDFTWSPPKPSQGEIVIFTNLSKTFGGTTISSYLWTITLGTGIFVDGTTNASSSPHIIFTTKTNKVKLQITDSDGYSCECKEKSLTVQLPLPEYKEIPPIIWLKKIFAGIVDIFDGFFKF